MLSRNFLWALLPIGLIGFLFFVGTEALNRPIVKIGMNEQCLSVVLIKNDQDVEVGCDVIDLNKDRYNVQHVFSFEETEEIKKALAHN